METKAPINKIAAIPESAISAEGDLATKPTDNSPALKEQKHIIEADYHQELQIYYGRTEIHHVRLYRWGITAVFIGACITAAFVISLFGYMFLMHVAHVTSSPEKLEIFLGETWKVLTGAAVIVMVRFVGWSLKSNANNLKNKKEG